MPQPLLPLELSETGAVLRRLSLTDADTKVLVAKGRETIAQSMKLLATVDAMLARTWGAP
jgi:hypothetical protein